MKLSFGITVLLSVFAFICIVGIADLHAQCAMCQATLESNAKTGTSQIGSTLNSGILYLMSIPYILIGTIGFFWYKQSKKNVEKNSKVSGILKDKIPGYQA